MSPATSSSISLVHLLFGQSGDFVLNPFLDIFLLLSLYEDQCAVWGKCELLGELQNASVCEGSHFWPAPKVCTVAFCSSSSGILSNPNCRETWKRDLLPSFTISVYNGTHRALCGSAALRSSELISWLCIKQSNDPKLTSCPAYNRRAHVCLMLLSFPLPFPACSALQSAGYSGQRTWAAPRPCAESHCSTTGNFLLHGAPV